MGNKIGQVIALVCGCISLVVVGCQPEKKTLETAIREYVAEVGETGTAARNRVTVSDGPDSVEELLTYEVRAEAGREYVVLTGIKEEYRNRFPRYLGKTAGKTSTVLFPLPDKINDIWVEEIAADAFRDITVKPANMPKHLKIVGDRAFLNTKMLKQEMILPTEIEQIGEEAFANSRISWVEFAGEQDLVIGKRAFADNEMLWAVYLPTPDCVIGEDAFTGCEKEFYLGYKERPEAGSNPVAEYAAANGLKAMWVPIIDSLEPMVRYPQEPLVLKPEIGNYFYGENGEGDNCLSGEEADDAPDYGFIAWHAPCGEWCVGEGFLDITASSELASADGRYAAKNLYALCGRESTWAEGVEGSGIGESITYHDCNDWHVRNHWDYIKYEEWYLENQNMINPLDGYIRYTQICIVNGYARDQNTWEKNGRVKTLLMYVEDKPYAYLELEDTIKPQYFTLPWEDIMVAERGDITFQFVIEDVYPGTTYEDTCLTGLVMEFTGRRGH